MATLSPVWAMRAIGCMERGNPVVGFSDPESEESGRGDVETSVEIRMLKSEC